MSEHKMNTGLAVIIALAVIAILYFVTITKKQDMTGQNINGEYNDLRTLQLEGVKVTVLNEGEGNVSESGDTVAVNYTGKLPDGTVFDSNVDPKFKHVEPLIFTIGAEQVIKGWDTGVDGMRIGEKRMLEIDPEYGYGEKGYGPIPPNSSLVFEVELLGIKK